VLFRARRGRWSKYRRFHSSYLTWIIALLIFSVTGCKDKRASLEKQYTEARLLFQQGFIEQPLPLAEAGFKESVGFPELNWKFRVLTAEARARKGRYDAALELLTPEPPSNISSEILWRRRIAQALFLCQSGQYPQTEERFAQAEALHAEYGALDYARGRCAMARHELGPAEHFLRLVTAQDSSPDPFLKAYALATLASLADRDHHYDEAIELNKECLPIVRTLHAAALEELVLGNLGDLYVQLRDFNNAIQNAQAAEKIAAQWKLLRDQQKWLFDIGFAQDIQGQSGKAEQSYNRALSIATQLGDKDIAAKCLRQLTALKLRQHQIDVAQRYHDQESKLGLQQENLKYWQLDEADITATRGDYALAILELQKMLQVVESEDPQHVFQYKLLWGIQSRLARYFAALNNNTEAEKWFNSSIATIDAATRPMTPAAASSLRGNIPVYDGYVAFLVAQKQYAEALHIAQQGRARTLLLDEEKSNAKKPVAEDAKAWLSKIQHYLARDKSVLLSYFETQDESYLWTVTAT